MSQSLPARFYVGEKVALRVDNHKVGVVIRVIPHGSGQPRYRVFHGPDEKEYDEQQLVLDRSGPDGPNDLIAALQEGRFVAPDEFRARVTSERLAHPTVDSLYAMRAARIMHVPFQYKPLLRLLRADQPRLLIADDVGVGKTIEAGLILKELEARGDVERVLVLCPRSLVHKWRSEMRRFDEDFKILDGATLQHCLREADIDGWPSEAARAILPMELIQRQEHLQGDQRRPGLLTLEQPPRFDLLIIDEAHHMRNTETARYDAARFLTTISHAAVMLSATPVHTGAENLFTLLQLLRADVFPNYDTFRRMIEPNRFVTNAMRFVRDAAAEDSWREAAATALESASRTSWGAEAIVRAPKFVQWAARLRSVEPMGDEERVTCLRDLEELHSLALVMNRTRRRDIGPFTQREPVTVKVPFTPEQQSFYDDLVAWRRQVLDFQHGSSVANLVISQIERQAASCLFGVVESLAEVVRTGKVVSRGDADDDDEGEMLLPPELRSEAADLLEQGRRLPLEDPKLDRLLQLLSDTSSAEEGPGKLLVFTSFRKTIAYLERAVPTRETRIAVVHGGVDDDARQALRARFRLPRADPDAIDVLLSTEVGAEGLDYEFCDRLVNYDIPWNPMRVEQRIGRIDRFGQRSPKVLIFNFVTPGTVEERVFMRCYERLGIFRDTVGDLEEILGETTAVLKQLAVDPRLTPEQAARKAQQEADNVTRRADEQRRLEQEAPGLLGLDAALVDEAEAIDERGRYVTGEELREIVEGFLRDQLHGGSLRPEPSDSTSHVYELRLRRSEHREELRSMLSRLPRSDRTAVELRKALGDDAPIWLTFDQELAVARREIQFITPVHPLARLAVGFWKSRTDPLVAHLSLTDAAMIPAGRYLFALERWEELAARPGARLAPIAVGFDNANPADHVAERLLAAVRFADAVPDTAPGAVSAEAADALDRHAHDLRQAAIAELQETNSALVDQRLASLDLFYLGMLAQLDAVLSASTDPKIIRMKTSERDRHRHEHRRRRAELERRRDADIVSTRIAIGVVEVRDAV